MSTRQWTAAGLIVTLAALVGVGLWQTSGGTGTTRVAVVREPAGVMGTSCRLIAVVNRGEEQRGERAIAAARNELTRVEALMSSWIEQSEVSQLNTAPANKLIPLSPETLEVLRAARRATAETRGAFDVTCRPVIELWREAGASGGPPDAEAIEAARAESNWSHFNLSDDGVVKTKTTAKIDLGGIAKGYAIDLAAGAMRACGVEGGMVDVGGDIRCFGRPADADEWIAQVRDPSGGGALGQFRLGQGAVCTSGDYARFVELDGERYSHIIDPRTGLPAKASSVTVVAPDALTADTWATALSVLGPEGLEWLPPNVEALLVHGPSESRRCTGTGRFSRFLP